MGSKTIIFSSFYALLLFSSCSTKQIVSTSESHQGNLDSEHVGDNAIVSKKTRRSVSGQECTLKIPDEISFSFIEYNYGLIFEFVDSQGNLFSKVDQYSHKTGKKFSLKNICRQIIAVGHLQQKTLEPIYELQVYDGQNQKIGTIKRTLIKNGTKTSEQFLIIPLSGKKLISSVHDIEASEFSFEDEKKNSAGVLAKENDEKWRFRLMGENSDSHKILFLLLGTYKMYSKESS